MTDFDPRPGWVETDLTWDKSGECLRWDNGTDVRYWVKEPPVPPLPTVPYTVIRVTYREFVGVDRVAMLMDQFGNWRIANKVQRSSDLLRSITGWEPLSEPRAVTAKAVLDRVRDLLPMSAANEPRVDEALTTIAREFGEATS